LARMAGELASMRAAAFEGGVGGPSRPSAVAVVRLTMRSNLVGCSTGRSPALAPRRILSTYSAARRYWLGRFDPYDIRAPASTNSRELAVVGSRAASAKVWIRLRWGNISRAGAVLKAAAPSFEAAEARPRAS